MKFGYTIDNSSYYGVEFLVIDNYKLRNIVAMHGCRTKERILRVKDKHSIGVWKIKNKKS